MFTSSNISKTPLLVTTENLSPGVTSYLASEIIKTTSPLTPIQQKLLLKHQQLGHLHVAKVQQLAKEGYLGPSSILQNAPLHCAKPVYMANSTSAISLHLTFILSIPTISNQVHVFRVISWKAPSQGSFPSIKALLQQVFTTVAHCLWTMPVDYYTLFLIHLLGHQSSIMNSLLTA